MKRIGLIGGVSPEATILYYRHLNAAARKKHGGQHSANVLYYMLDYGVMIDHYHHHAWPDFIAEVVRGAEALKAGGAEALAITSGTTHVGAAAAAERTGLPLIHMHDSLTRAMQAQNIQQPLLTGTPWVMSGDFFKPELAQRYHGNIITPSAHDRDMIGRIIFDELVEGVVTPASRADMASMVGHHQQQGADAVILGCTELCMILEQADCDIPVLDATAIHAADIAQILLGD
ncbi:aspartate/glutamate racemase family protein [Parvularcula sp. IMCC14364]|uniref:aspartate/glutamate racemase family protein n=1 Tax=Parvularcula sp. IMCC14364 TaxID=3067902 RepID=UPI0027427198|nr:amino acid racemase [Parvularcula sp. IMCC14364]